MGRPPRIPRAVSFVDGQNLFHAAREAFGHAWPDYDPRALSARIAGVRGWRLEGVRFYTGLPSARASPRRHQFWASKLRAMSRQGIYVCARPLRYRTRTIAPDVGPPLLVRIGEEKGIDVRIAIDLIRLAHRRELDVAILFSQDQDFVEVAREIREIAREQRRWIKLASAFPIAAGYSNTRGIDGTDWIPFDRAIYESCLDPEDHRGKGRRGGP